MKKKSRLRLLQLLCDHVCITGHYNAIIRRQLTSGWWFQVPFSYVFIRAYSAWWWSLINCIVLEGGWKHQSDIIWLCPKLGRPKKNQWFINVYHHFHHFHWVFQPSCATFPPLANHHADRRKSAGHVDLLQSAAAAAAGRLDLGLTFRGWKGGPIRFLRAVNFISGTKLKW